MSIDNIIYDQLDIATEGDGANKIDINDINELLKDSSGINILQNAFDSSNETITSRLSEIKNSLINSLDFSSLNLNNGSSDIYAIQIIGHIINPFIVVDGLNGKQTHNILNNKNIFPNYHEKVREKPMDPDLKDVLDNTINGVINSYLKDLNSNEGINLSTEGIYNNVIEIIDNLGIDINNNSLYKEDIQTLKNNFLLPKDKGFKLIKFIIKEHVLNKNNDGININKNNINGYFKILESTLGTLYDIGTNKSEEELKVYFNKMKNIEGISEIFNKYPDLENVLLNIIPGVIKNIPKEQFMGSLEVFLDKIKGDILIFNEKIINNKDISDDKFNNSKMSVINNLSVFFLSIVNKESIDIFSSNIVNLDLIKNNEILSKLFELVNYETLDSNDRILLVTELLVGVNLFSLNDISDENLNNYINSLTSTIASISSKLPKDKILSLINSIKGNSETESSIIEDGDINYIELGSFLRKNKGKILSVMGEWINSDSKDFKEFIIEVFQNEALTKSLNGLGIKIVEKLRKIAGIDLKNILQNIRKDFLKYDLSIDNIEIDKKEIKLSNIENDLIGLIGFNLEKDIGSLVLQKISSDTDNNLNKDEIIEVGIYDLKDIINTNTELVFDYVKELGGVIESDQDKKNILSVINSVLDNPKFKEIINDIVTNIGSGLENKKDIRGELNKLLKDSYNSSAINLLNNDIKNNIQELTIETAYNDILGNKDSLKTVFNVLKTNLGSNIDIPDDKIYNVGHIIKNHLSEESFKTLVDGIDFNNLDIKKIGQKLYNKIEDKVGFVNDLINLGVLDAACKIDIGGEVCDTNKKLTIENTKIAIDLLYSTLNDSSNDVDDDNVAKLLNKVIEQHGLTEIAKLELLGKNLGENIVAFLNSIEKDKLTNILINNNEIINDLIGSQINQDKTSLISKISTDLLNGLNIDQFKEKYDNENLTDMGKMQLDLFDEIQELSISQSNEIEGLTDRGIYIYDIYNGKNELNEQNEEEIKRYGEEVFDMINLFINKIDDKYLENNLKIPDGNGEKDSLVGSLISSFVSENKWFIVKEGIKGVFTGFSSGKTIDNYFRDSDSNRENFGDTLKDFVIDNNKKI